MFDDKKSDLNIDNSEYFIFMVSGTFAQEGILDRLDAAARDQSREDAAQSPFAAR